MTRTVSAEKGHACLLRGLPCKSSPFHLGQATLGKTDGAESYNQWVSACEITLRGRKDTSALYFL